MKKILGALLGFFMILGVVFVDESISPNGSLSAKAQTTSIKRKTRHGSSRTYRSSKRVGRKGWYHTKRGSAKVVKGTRWTSHKTKRGAKKTFRKTKEIFH